MPVNDNDAINVGLLHSLSGPMAISEAPLVGKGFACDWSDPANGAKYSLQAADS